MVRTQYSKGFVNLEIGDEIQIGDLRGDIYDIRFIQELRESRSWFEVRLADSEWTSLDDIQVIQRRVKEGEGVE